MINWLSEVIKKLNIYNLSKEETVYLTQIYKIFIVISLSSNMKKINTKDTNFEIIISFFNNATWISF